MSEVEAISFDEVECGKKVAESKKRFKWRFKIKGKSYLMELANSAISGKRIVTLDSVQIYSQKNVFNINFDFMHKIDGHILRITRTPDNINKFEMRIDNRNFDEILNKSSWDQSEKTSNVSLYKKQEADPFSEFGNFASSTKPETKNNEFGDFGDFDLQSFSKPAAKTNTAQAAPTTQKKQEVFDPFANYNKKPATTGYETVNFQTNTFQTNNFGNFAQNFSKVEQNLMDEGNFATNTYGQNNLYNDFLQQKPNQRSEAWNEFTLDAEKPSSFKIEMTGKQVLNKVKKTAEELKNKITGYSDSLI